MMKRIGWVPMMGAAIVLSGLLAGCGQTQAVYPDKELGDSAPRMGDQPRKTIFGDGLRLFGGGGPTTNIGIAVNSYLWRASLDTLSFMPIASADPFGGTILTDWYQLPEAPDERFKLNVFILGRALRADGVRVAVFKQVKGAGGQWADAKVDPKMVGDVENAILTRARQLRIVSE